MVQALSSDDVNPVHGTLPGPMSPETTHRLRVRYNECDQIGIVFNANYLVYADIAATEFFREHLGGYQALNELGLDFAMAEANIRFRRPLHYDEEFEVKVAVTSITSRSLSMEFKFIRGEEVVSEIDISYVCIETESQAPQVIPEEFSSVLEGVSD